MRGRTGRLCVSVGQVVGKSGQTYLTAGGKVLPFGQDALVVVNVVLPAVLRSGVIALTFLSLH